MSIWTKSLTSPQADEKIRAIGRTFGRLAFSVLVLALLALWTYIVRAIHDYSYRLNAWSDGASKRSPDDWTPYVVLWFVPVLLTVLIGLTIRASRAKRNTPNQPLQPRGPSGRG